MFKFDEICELIRLVGSTGIAGVEIERAGSRIKIEGTAPPAAEGMTSVAQVASVPVAPMPQQPLAVAPLQGQTLQAAPALTEAESAALEEEGLHFVASPIVGTFYRAPNPDADPYVKVGDFVEKGQVLCIVEAMKLMNEIESDLSGAIVKVYVENAQPVEFGERLFAIRPA